MNDLDACKTTCDCLRDIIDRNIAENARLRVENERLRAVLLEIAEPELDEGDDDPTEPTFGARYYVNRAREALAEK